MNRNAFTMLELIFAIVVLGILASVALPRLAASRDDAQMAKCRSDIAAIRSAIMSERQTRLLRGDSSYISQLHVGTAGEKTTLFDSNGSSTSTLLQYGIVTKDNSDGHWDSTVAQNGTSWRYILRIMDTNINFDYNSTNGRFDCDRSVSGKAGTYCKKLVD